MSWLESHQELRDHPKTARLRRRLGVSLPAAIGHLHLLWWWAIDYAPSGDLSAFDADVIADAGGWEDDAGLFVRALIGAGFLDEDLTIHDWDDYAGRLIDKREANARRMRAARYARRAELGDTAFAARPVDGTPDVHGTFAGRERLPDHTGPDHTGPDSTPPPHPPPHAEGARNISPNIFQPAKQRRRSRSQGVTTAEPPQREVPADLVPATDADRALWDSARDRLTDGWLPSNREKAEAFEPLGRDPSGWLWLRAPPWASSVASQHQLAAALVNAGDPFGQGVVVVEG